MMAASAVPIIHTLFELTSGTWQYVVAYSTASQAGVIDPVLDFNTATNELSTKLVDEILALVQGKGIPCGPSPRNPRECRLLDSVTFLTATIGRHC